jgi:hypothetical protein
MFRVQVTGEDRITRMARAVANGPDELRHQYDRSVRRAGQRTLREVKQAARRVPIHGFRAGRRRYRGPSTPKGLRARIAAAVHLDLSTGTLSPRAQFTVRTAQVGAGRVPEYIESGKRWRHPIMGNRRAWASSQGRPWFEVTVRRAMPRFERDIDTAVQRTARAIERNA